MFICKRTRVLRTHVCTKIFQISVALCGATVYYVVKQGRKGATYRLGNEVTKMSKSTTYFDNGSHVREIFASKLKTLVNGLSLDNASVVLSLNQQDNDENITLFCNHGYAYEYITFMNALDSEILAYGVAIVIAKDNRANEQKDTIFVVCGDEL